MTLMVKGQTMMMMMKHLLKWVSVLFLLVILFLKTHQGGVSVRF